MTLVSQIITDAYQYNNIVALNVIPSAAETAKGLRYFNRILSGVFGNEVGDRLKIATLASDLLSVPDDNQNTLASHIPGEIPGNVRLLASLTAPSTIKLPALPNDGMRFAVQDSSGNFNTNSLTLSANGRRIEDATQVVLNTANTNTEWFYREDLGNWVKLAELASTDTFPFPREFEEYFITMLGIRLGSSEDVEMNQQLAIVMQEASRKLRSRYRQKTLVGPETGYVAMTTNRTNLRFNYG